MTVELWWLMSCKCVWSPIQQALRCGQYWNLGWNKMHWRTFGWAELLIAKSGILTGVVTLVTTVLSQQERLRRSYFHLPLCLRALGDDSVKGQYAGRFCERYHFRALQDPRCSRKLPAFWTWSVLHPPCRGRYCEVGGWYATIHCLPMWIRPTIWTPMTTSCYHSIIITSLMYDRCTQNDPNTTPPYASFNLLCLSGCISPAFGRWS